MILVLVQAQVNIIFYKSKCARNWKIVDLSRNCAVCIILQTLRLSPKGKRNSIEKASKFVEAPVLPTLIYLVLIEHFIRSLDHSETFKGHNISGFDGWNWLLKSWQHWLTATKRSWKSIGWRSLLSDFFLENELDVVIGDALTLHFTVFFSDDSKLHKIESRVDTTLPPEHGKSPLEVSASKNDFTKKNPQKVLNFVSKIPWNQYI